MADIRDPWAFILGRWNWTRHGYEKGWGRIAFSDIDAHLEVNGHHLFIEAKHWDGAGPLPQVSDGERRKYQAFVKRGDTVLLLFGCAPDNDPRRIDRLVRDGDGVRREPMPLLGLPLDERRAALKQELDQWFRWASHAEASAWTTLIDPDCRDNKHSSCVGGPCQCDCHAEDAIP